MGAAPIALTISRDANTGAGQDPHRPSCGGSTPPSCRDWVASIAAMQRFLKPQSTGQHRGDPPFHAGVAQQRQQQFRKLPGNPPHGSASLPVGPNLCSRSSNHQSGRLRTARLQVRFLPGVPFCRVSPTTRGAPLRTERLGVELPHAAPFGLSQDRARRSRPGDQLAGGLTADSCALGASTISKAPVAQGRGNGLKPRLVSVQS